MSERRVYMTQEQLDRYTVQLDDLLARIKRVKRRENILAGLIAFNVVWAISQWLR
jgi:hypothetical protein